MIIGTTFYLMVSMKSRQYSSLKRCFCDASSDNRRDISLSTKPVPAIHVENLTLSSGVDVGCMVHRVEGSGSMGQLS
jgi:hypothetical protein